MFFSEMFFLNPSRKYKQSSYTYAKDTAGTWTIWEPNSDLPILFNIDFTRAQPHVPQ